MDKKTLQDYFISYLETENKYPKDSIEKDWILEKNGDNISFDIAIVVNGIVVQAFMLFDDEQTPTSPIAYTQIIDTVAVSSKSLIAIYNTGNKNWKIQTSTNIHTQMSKCFMTFSKAGGDFVECVKTKIEKERWLPTISEFKKICGILFSIYALYLIVYILLCVTECDYQVPMSWEFLTYITLLLMLGLLPYVVPFIKHIKIKDLEIDLLESEISKRSN